MKQHHSLSLPRPSLASLLLNGAAAAILSLGLLLAGCTETLDTHGQVLQPSSLQQLEVGTTTKDDVRGLLGSPSVTGTLNDNRWIYVSAVMGQQAFDPNDLKSRRVLVLDFDPATGVLTEISERTEAHGRDVTPSRATTATQGQTLGFFEQVFGNLGLGN